MATETQKMSTAAKLAAHYGDLVRADVPEHLAARLTEIAAHRMEELLTVQSDAGDLV